MEPKEYKVHTALRDDVSEGTVWIKDPRLEQRSRLTGNRRIACITSPGGMGQRARKIHCEVLQVDCFYLNRWKENCLARIDILEHAPPRYRVTNVVDDVEQDLDDFLRDLEGGCDLIFISKWHRTALGLDGLGRQNLTVRIPEAWLLRFWHVPWLFRAGVEHPQIVVHLATVLALIGIGLGLIGLGAGLPAIKDVWKDVNSVRAVKQFLKGLLPNMPWTTLGQWIVTITILLGVFMLSLGIVSMFRRSLRRL